MKKVAKTTRKTAKSSKKSSLFARLQRSRSLVFVSSFAVLGLIIIGISSAAPGNRCQQRAPYIQIHNNYAWAQWGTWAKAGQTVPYQLQAYSYDTGNCRRDTYTVELGLPTGFTTDTPSFSVALRPGESQLKMVNITSPANTADGDYPVAAKITRAASSLSGNTTSYYKVYSSDNVVPTFYWTSPSDGSTVTGQARLSNSSRDNYMVRKIELYIDGVLVDTETNVGIVNDVTIHYDWDTRSVTQGQHSLTYKAYDDFNNVATQSINYTVQ